MFERIERLEAANEKLSKDIEKLDAEHTQQLVAKNAEHTQQLVAKNAEHTQQLVAKNAEHTQQLVARNKEHIQQLEAMDKEHNEEVDKLKEKQKDDAFDFLLCSQELVRLRGVCNIRAALDRKGEDPILYEPVNKVLEKLSNDERFKECLIKTCEDNQMNIEVVKKCIGGLYHTSKELHGYDKVAIFEKDWAVNEIIALGLIFKYYGVPFEYMNANEQLAEFPYKLASRLT
ncbi:hypothetical protein C2G38_2164850 [Gigaspora rosea]|uniref:Uncharacterized protein n=1 Tax=Gigaspora rosea TaxID=44941 RepID=A0A397VTI7_9GLOM|nr:hypothetical protein C2G38_2164850 [Gigaspora rosea]